jgi:ATP/maltotriose-dependent transcriptional regulator MalT
VRLTEGAVAAAADYLERARPLLEQAPLPDWTSRYERCQGDLWLAQDRPQAADAEGRAGIQIEALALQSLAQRRAGDRIGALTALERALRLAEPEGYVRLFADLASSASTAGVLPEPLSLREQEVLKLIAAGLTNREIAETLVISPETVKKHTGSIYGKLGVPRPHRSRGQSTRTQRALLATIPGPCPTVSKNTPLAYPIRGMTTPSHCLTLQVQPRSGEREKEVAHVRTQHVAGAAWYRGDLEPGKLRRSGRPCRCRHRHPCLDAW